MKCDKTCKAHPEAEPVLQVNPAGSTTYGKWLCGECRKYISHAKFPKNDEEANERQAVIRDYLRVMLAVESIDDNELHAILVMYNAGRSINYSQQDAMRRIRDYLAAQ